LFKDLTISNPAMGSIAHQGTEKL